MKPYSEYKDSGFEWLGLVPKHWGVCPLKRVISSNDEILAENTDKHFEFNYVDISSVSLEEGVKSNQRMAFKDSPSRARRIARNGDIIISTVRTYLRAIAVVNCAVNEKLIVSTGFAVLRCKDRTDSRYMGYSMKNIKFVEQVSIRSNGVSYPAINTSELITIHIPIPSLLEQQSIADYLDQETAKMDSLITEQEELISLLKQKRSAIISEAVCRGVDPAVPMKDSGVEWLGIVPEDWKLSRFEKETWVRARLGWKGLKAEEYLDDSDYIFLAIPNIKNKEIDFNDINYISKDRYEESPEIMLKQGDILLAKDGSTLGTVNIVQYLPGNVTVNGSIAVITSHGKCLSDFIYYWIQGNYVQNVIKFLKDGAGVPHLFQRDINKMMLLVPPLPEQQAIVDYLDRETAEIDHLIADCETSIQLLKQRRTSLISEAVTGKIDVRTA